MKKLGVLLLMATFILTGASTMMAQGDTHEASHQITITIPNIAYLDIEAAGSTDVALSPSHSTEAGDPLDFTGMTNNLLWLNYSSIVPSGVTRKVTVELSTTVPAGMSMELTPGSPTTGAGERGIAAVGLSPDDDPSDVVTGIGSCYTVDGVGNGVNLVYDLDIDAGSYGTMVADAHVIDVTYTLTDE